MSLAPKVSVLLPTYNYARFLDDAIQSVLAQTFYDYELLIVDNASTDNTDEVVQKYLNDSRIKYFKNKENLGVVGNWNKCLDHSSGELIKFLCADDKFRPELLEKYVKLMDEYSNLSMVACNKRVFGDGIDYEVTILLTHMQKGRDLNLHMIYGHQGVGEPTSVMFRRREFEKIGFFTNRFTQYVDFDYWLKLLTLGDCYLIPEILVDIRFHPGTISSQVKYKKFVRIFEDYQITKDVQQQVYDIDIKETQVNEIVKKNAMTCVKQAMLKTIPHIHKKPYRKAFVKAFKIAWNERLFAGALSEFGAGMKRKFSRTFFKTAVQN